ncbi:MAG: hypothetical protein ACHQF0_13890 [Chitinophagales bacterium]
MKNRFVYPAILIGSLICIQSCTKNLQDKYVPPVQPTQFINVSVSSGQTYVFTGGSGTLNVSRQASHYETSQTGSDEKGSAIYKYNSALGYTGPDEVTLLFSPKSVTPGSTGGCPESQNKPNSSTTYIGIKINVTK